MAATLLIAAALAQAAPAWRTIHEADSALYALDPASLTREGDRVRARMRASRAEPMADGISSVVAEVELDCRARTATLLGRTAFGADGRLLAALEVPAEQRRAEPLRANAEDEALHRSLCAPPPATP